LEIFGMSVQESQPIDVHLFHLDQGALRKVLDNLDNQPLDPDATNRKYERYPYRNQKIILCTRSSRQNVAFLVPARNISLGGVSLMHTQMLYPRQRCGVGLPNQPGKWLILPGQVARCRYVSGMLHEIAVQFLRPLDPMTLQHLRDAAPVSTPPAETVAWITWPA